MKIAKIFYTVVSMVLLAQTSSVLAVNRADTDDTVATDSTAQSTATAGAIARCQTVEAKIQTKLQNYTTAKEKFTTAFDNLQTRLDAFDLKIKAKGYDTTMLEADIAVLKQKVTDFKTLVADANTQLQQTQTYTCGQSQGQFVKSLALARQKIRLTHQKALEIRTFYRDVIRVDLVALKDQTASVTTGSN